jgi:hypothetical protein
MKQLALTCIITLCCCKLSNGQKQTTHVQQVWFGYVNQIRFSEHWGTWLDLHLRTKEDFVNDLSTGIVRAGITYTANERLKFTAGYAYVNFFPADDHDGVSQPEHRPWQQVYWQTPGVKSRLVNSIRLEERYRRKIRNSNELDDGYNFNYRVRYNTMLFLPLSRRAFAPNTLSVSLNNEIHVNFGKQIVYNYFDQNRFLAGFAYHVNEKDYLQFGYMNLFQQLAAGNKYRMSHVARAYYYHNLDLRKSKKNQKQRN